MEKIIKKKLLLVVSMLAVMFALAGCSLSDKVVEFTYDPDALATLAKSEAENYMEIAANDQVYNYYVSDEAGLDESIVENISAFATLEDDYGEFIDFESEYTYEEVEDTVAVKLYAKCADKEAVIKATFVDNSVTYEYYKYYYMSQNDCSEDEAVEALATNSIYPYSLSEFEVSENQTMGDKMKAAGAHTVIGMGIVFIALIFISFIISLLKYVPALFGDDSGVKKSDKKDSEKKPEKSEDVNTKAAPAPVPQVVDIVNTATGQSAMDDSELVAVITAAVMASEGGRTRTRVNYPSNDKLVVRPRRRNKR